jgi:hypothetical protein
MFIYCSDPLNMITLKLNLLNWLVWLIVGSLNHYRAMYEGKSENKFPYFIATKYHFTSYQYSGPLTYELNSFAMAGRNSSWS